MAVVGYLYVLSNASMPGLLKIGFTTRPVAERVAELNSATGVPSPFRIEACFERSNPKRDEALVRKRLSATRILGREFFRVSVDEALRVLA